MSSSIEIIAIGDNKEKGRSLERSVGQLLTSLGFKDVRYNIHRTGEEVDVTARHRLSNEPIMAQCKAHQDPINSPPVRLFFGDLKKERQDKTRTSGIFVSLSGFIGTAYEWYDELDDAAKDYFKLLDGNQFCSYLQKEGHLSSCDNLISIIQARTSLPIKEISLLLTEIGFFWRVVTWKQETGQKYISFFNNEGGSPNRSDIEYLLKRINIVDEKHILLQSHHNVIKYLYKESESSIRKIAESINESEDDVSATIDELKAQSLIEERTNKIFLRTEIDTFISLFKEAATEDSIIDFMLSNYFNSTINIIPNYISAKYLVELDEQEIESLVRIIKISPKALEIGLLGDSTKYRNNEDHIRKINLPKAKAEEWRTLRKSDFFSQFYEFLLSDLKDQKNSPLVKKYEISAYVNRFQIKLGKRFEQYLSLSGETNTMLVQLDGEIKAGQLLSATGPGPLLLNADTLAAMGEDEKAIKIYDGIIKNYPNSESAVAAINNKGLIFLKLKNTKEAIPLFEIAKKEKFAEEVALKNLARCYAIKHQYGCVEQICNKLVYKKLDKHGNIDDFKQQLLKIS